MHFSSQSLPPQIDSAWKNQRFSEISASDRVDTAASAGWTWKQASTLSNGKGMSAREGHSAVALENMLVLFGGCYLDKECFNDVTVLDVNEMRWTTPVVDGMLPPAREGHSASMIGTRMYVFAGSSEIGYLNDLHVLDLEPRRLVGEEAHMAWGQPEISGTPPEAREGHSGTASDGSIIIFGGYSEAGYRNDVFALDTDLFEWTKPAVTGSPPSPREGHTATMFEDSLVIFGGYTDLGGTALNDVLVLDTRSFAWSAIKMGGEAPKARQDAAAVRHGPKLLVVGGCNFYDRICYNDLYELDMAAKKWSKPAAAAGKLSAREGHTLTVVRNRPLLTGGCYLDQKCFGGNDIVELTSGGDDFTCGGDNCTGNGLCRHGMCLCLPGFGGSDCGDRMHCPKRCSGHGACLNTGHCACELGFSGRDCSFSEACPQKCSGRGECLQGGVCRCLPAWSGEACDVCRVGSRVACNAKGVCFLNATAPARFASRPILTAPRDSGRGARFVSGGAALLATEGTSVVRNGDGQQLYVAEVAQTPGYGCKCDPAAFGPSCTLDAAAKPPPLAKKKDPSDELCSQPQFAATSWCSPMSRALHAEMMRTSNLTLAKLLAAAADGACDGEADPKDSLACIKAGGTPSDCCKKKSDAPPALKAEYDGAEAEAGGKQDQGLMEKADWWEETPGGGKTPHVKGPQTASNAKSLRLAQTKSTVASKDTGTEVTATLKDDSPLRMKERDQEQLLVEALMRGVTSRPTAKATAAAAGGGKDRRRDAAAAAAGEGNQPLAIKAAPKAEGAEDAPPGSAPGEKDATKAADNNATPAPAPAPAPGASDRDAMVSGKQAKAKESEKSELVIRRCPETCEHGGGHGRCSHGVCFCVPGYYGEDCTSKVAPDDAKARRQHLVYYVGAAGIMAGAFLALLCRPLGGVYFSPPAADPKKAPWIGWADAKVGF